MGILDEVLQQLTQQQGQAGNTARGTSPSSAGPQDSPLMVIFQELLLGKQPAGAQSAPQQQAEVPKANASAQRGSVQQGDSGAGDLGGLGGLLAQLQASGLDDVVRSWVGSGENKPVQPDALGDALGKKAVTQMADKAGCDSKDLLSQLAKALPGIIDKLTTDGRIPTQQEIAQRLRSQ